MDAVVGLGSNLGDRRATLLGAVSRLGEIGHVVGVSALYETDPVGPPQPTYLNAALRLETDLGPGALFARMLEIEREHGRERGERWQARTLDLDLLWIAGVTLETPELIVPHPRLVERAFALLPLLDVAPEATDPATRIPYARIADDLDRSGVRIAEPPEVSGSWCSPAAVVR